MRSLAALGRGRVGGRDESFSRNESPRRQRRSSAATAKIRAVFELKPSVPEAPDARVLPPVEGEIRFENVTFGYDDDRPVLDGIDFTVQPGETFALVGETGAGKSTIAKLVTRFYDPQSGRVTLDGHDLRGLRFDALRRQIGVVPQEEAPEGFPTSSGVRQTPPGGRAHRPTPGPSGSRVDTSWPQLARPLCYPGTRPVESA